MISPVVFRALERAIRRGCADDAFPPEAEDTAFYGRECVAQRIDVKDLNIYYGDFMAVQGVSMTIEPKSVTAFIGPSGCGKSTFLRTLNRMHEVIPGAHVEG